MSASGYSVTSPTAALRRALNRERSNVGRSAYTDRVKAILLACDQDEVIDTLVTDLQKYGRGTWHDKTQWLDVGLHACKQLNARRQVIFLTAFELSYAADLVPGADHGVALSQLRTGQGDASCVERCDGQQLTGHASHPSEHSGPGRGALLA